MEKMLRHVVGDLLVVGILGGVLYLGANLGIFAKLGLNSYNGLSPAQIKKVYAEFQRRYPPLSKVHGYLFGTYFERGIAGSQGGILYYFHWTDDGRGNVSFSLYPELFERWDSDVGLFSIGKLFTGSPVYP